ncbi:MAG: protein translocase subunit SecF [Bdellovibrionales bacterium]|nr:protein translocase subunit SecF [Bdellovibrionales bacterium]
MSQKFFQIVPTSPNFSFARYAPIFFACSGVFLAVCFYSLFTKGLNYGVDFKGGSEIYARFEGQTTAKDIREALEPIGYSDASVQSFGDRPGEFLIRVAPEDLKLTNYETNIRTALQGLGGDSKELQLRFSEERVYAVLPQATGKQQVQDRLKGIDDAYAQIESVTPFGRASDKEFVIQFSGVSSRIVKALEKHFGVAKMEVLQIEEVGEKVGSELRTQALGAVLISIILILIYIWFRFDFEFAPGAIIALVHDAVVILGVFSIMRLQFDLSTVAAVLTVVGFSINDTIVTYDRVRENIRKTRNMLFGDIVNLSINETLSRTILTSLTLLFATVVLFLYGGPITKNFALALTLGVVFGTYSTIFIASPLTIYVRKYLMARQS